MKYREIKNIRTRGGVTMTNQGLYLIQELNQKRDVIQIDTNGNECDKYDFIDMSKVYRLRFTKDYFITSFKNGITIFYTLDKKKVFELNKQLYFLLVKEDDIYIYIENDGNLYRFNKESHNMESSLLISNELFLSCLFDNNLVFEQKGGVLFLYTNQSHGVTLSWQYDLKILYPDQEEIAIKEIKEYQGSIIVVTTGGVLRLSAEDGSVIWKADGYARTMEIVDNIGYVCTGLSLLRINLDTGEESGYGWENHRLPDFTYKGKNYWPIGHKVVFHDGLLWYSVYSSGDSFLIAINPQNGNYEWIHYVDTNEKTDAPQFYEDKMFLWDTGNILHVYEKE